MEMIFAMVFLILVAVVYHIWWSYYRAKPDFQFVGKTPFTAHEELTKLLELERGYSATMEAAPDPDTDLGDKLAWAVWEEEAAKQGLFGDHATIVAAIRSRVAELEFCMN